MKRLLVSRQSKVVLVAAAVAVLTLVSWGAIAGTGAGSYGRTLDMCLAFNLSLMAAASMIAGALLPAYLMGRSNRPLLERGFLWGFLGATGLLAFILIWLRVVFVDAAAEILTAYPTQIIPLAVLMAIFFSATATIVGRFEARGKK